MRGPTSGSPDLGRVIVREGKEPAGGKTPDRGYGAGESLAKRGGDDDLDRELGGVRIPPHQGQNL